MKKHQRPHHAYPKFEKKLTSNEFIAHHRFNETDFTRKRSLPFHKVFYLLINFSTKSLQAELDNLFKVLLNKEVPVNEVIEQMASKQSPLVHLSHLSAGGTTTQRTGLVLSFSYKHPLDIFLT